MKKKYPDDVELVYYRNMITEIKMHKHNDKILRFNCSYSWALKTLPQMPNLRSLWVDNCSSLVELPDYPNLSYLNLNFTENFKNLPDAPKLIKLVNCGNETKISHKYEKLTELIWNHSTVLNFENFPNVKYLILKGNLVKILPDAEYKSIDITGANNLTNVTENYKSDYVKSILKKWTDLGLCPYDEEKGYLFWKCVSPDMKGNLDFQYEINKEYINSGMACPGPFGALTDWDIHKAYGSRVMAVWAKSIYPVKIKKGVYHILKGTPQAVYLAKDISKEGFTPILIQGEEDDGIRKVLG